MSQCTWTLLPLLGALCLSAAAPAPTPARRPIPAPVYGPPPRAQFVLGPYQRAPPPPPPPPPPPVYRPVMMVATRFHYPKRVPPAPTSQYGPPLTSQRYRVEQQGIWRYTAPIRDAPLREDEVPFQGLGASESVTMPEAPPFDPLLLRGPSALQYVRALSAQDPYFFPDFPHTMLVLNNQQQRLNNGLAAHRLGSIRPGSDFFRLD